MGPVPDQLLGTREARWYPEREMGQEKLRDRPTPNSPQPGGGFGVVIQDQGIQGSS